MNIFLVRTAASGAAAAARFMIFLIVLILLLWIVNAVRHFRNGSTTAQKAVDIIGAAVLAGIMIAMTIPLM